MLKNLREIAETNLKAYPTGIEEDLKTLQTPDLPYKRRCCLKQIIGEKKALRLLLNMAQTGLELLDKATLKEAQDHYALINPPPIYASYIEEELLLLPWT